MPPKPEKTDVTVIFIGQEGSGKSTITDRLISGRGVDKRDELIEEAEERGKDSFSLGSAPDRRTGDGPGRVPGDGRGRRERGVNIEFGKGNIETKKYGVNVIDAPGHRDFIKDMVAGITMADCAVLIVSASTGEFEAGMSESGQTREHALLAYTLGVKQLIVGVNKMDITEPPYSQARFDEISKEVSVYLKKMRCDPKEVTIIPISGLQGDNMTELSSKMPWYKGWSVERDEGNASGLTLLDALDAIPPHKRLNDKPLRLPISDVNTISGIGFVPGGRVESGVLKPGMTVTLAPSGLTAELSTVYDHYDAAKVAEYVNNCTVCRTYKVKSVEMHKCSVPKAVPGDNVSFSFFKHVARDEIKAGNVAGDSKNDPPKRAKSFVAEVLLLDHPGWIEVGYTAVVNCHVAHVSCRFIEIKQKLDRFSGKVLEENPTKIQYGDAALVTMEPREPLCVEAYADYPPLGQFALVDRDASVVAVGVIKAVEKDE